MYESDNSLFLIFFSYWKYFALIVFHTYFQIGINHHMRVSD